MDSRELFAKTPPLRLFFIAALPGAVSEAKLPKFASMLQPAASHSAVAAAEGSSTIRVRARIPFMG